MTTQDKQIIKKYKNLSKEKSELLKRIETLSFEERSRLKLIEEQIKLLQNELNRQE